MSDNINTLSSIGIIAKNSDGFDFVEVLGTFINNLKFKQGYNEYLSKKDTKDAYIWTVLSAIGNDYGETIYENVIDYLDNVSNVDLCKIKALQSMIQVIGLRYDVFDTFRTIPVEIANLMDILSINKSYLLNSKVFKKEFIDFLSSSGCIVKSSDYVDLQNQVLSADEYTVSNEYIDEDKYKTFLESLYRTILKKYVYLQYADAENGLSSENEYIYQYIQSDILASQTTANVVDLTPHQQKMSQLKIKYNINKDFDESTIVDAIENGYDLIDRYNIYEQEILKAEILYREQTYSFVKKYKDPEESFLGFNLTRYSYYREKKVKEYFSFIDNTYNNLLIETGIVDTIAGRSTDNDSIVTYDKDINYFDINQANRKTLLTYDPLTQDLEIQASYIDVIAHLLANQTLQIAEIRDQIKLQIRKSYMRGSFLLVSYIVNEFLKYGIIDKYGNKFSTTEGVDLGTIMNSSISTGENVQLVEYYDDTEYFNITTSSDPYALYSETVNDKFWDNAYNKIGVDSQDIPLNEIENFYLKQLKLEHDNIDDVVNFLSIVYEYGANNSYINKMTKQFTCQLHDGRWIGDPYEEISALEASKLSIQQIHETIDEYIANGEYEQTLSTIAYQFNDLSTQVSAYYCEQISNANESTKESLQDEYEKNLDEALQIDESFRELSSSYEDLKKNPDYQYYLSSYVDSDSKYFIEKIHDFNNAICNTIDWRYVGLSVDLTSLLNQYQILSNELYDRLFSLSVWQIENDIQYWPWYSPQYENELTSVTMDLKLFLVDQAQIQNDGALQHLQNHYDKLLSYKNDINNILQECLGADSKLDGYATGIESRTGIKLSEPMDKYSTILYWSKEIVEKKVSTVISSDPTSGTSSQTVKVTEGTNRFWLTDTTSYYVDPYPSGDSIEKRLQNLFNRSNYPSFDQQVQKKNKLVDTFYLQDYGPCTNIRDLLCWDEYYASIGPTGMPTGKTREYYTVKVPALYTGVSAIAYDMNDIKYPYKSDADAQIQSDILDAYRKAVDNLNATIDLINAELTCLGYSRIDIHSDSIDDVSNNTSQTYEQLIGRIENLTKIIQCGMEPNGWPSLTSDLNLIPFKEKLNRISSINSIESLPYNVRYIDTKFNDLVVNFNNVLALNSNYLKNYVNNDADRLDKQIQALSTYMIEHDKFSKDEVSSQLSSISVDYYKLLDDFNIYASLLKRDEVYGIMDNYSYMLSSITYMNEIYSHISSINEYNVPIQYKDYLDYLLCGNYINGQLPQQWTEKLSGVLYWIPEGTYKFDDSAAYYTYMKVPSLNEYAQMTSLIYVASTQYLAKSMDEVILLTDKLDELAIQIDKDIAYISNEVDIYNAKKQIYLKYNGTDIGYDPYYNYKNQAYSSYQIHPYLYNFIEKSNIIYPLANAFFASFGSEYEKNLYEHRIDKILGPYGNIKDLWKSGMFDWTSYQSKYEKALNTSNASINVINPNIGFTGLFYPPALDAFMNDPDTFIQNVQDNTQDSYYYHLNLTNEQIDKIVQQLTEYEPMVRTVAQRWKSMEPALSTEFDIYKYAEDAYGNSLFLLKSYAHLYEANSNISSYSPSYNDKKNAYGEIWMRIKDHPLAFPAFDLRSGYEGISQYSILSTSNSIGKPINEYIKDIDDYLTMSEMKYPWLSCTLDTIGLSSTIEKKQHLRCFFDMELDPTHRSLLLVVPIYTGKNTEQVLKSTIPDRSLMTMYGNSSILLSFLDVAFDYNNNVYVYNCFNDVYMDDQVNVNLNNIPNETILVKISESSDPIPADANTSKYATFVGFAKNGNIIHSIFANRDLEFNSFATYHKYSGNLRRVDNPRLSLKCISYKCHTQLQNQTVYSDDLIYDIFSTKLEQWNGPLFNGKQNYYATDLFKNAQNIVLASGNERLTIGFLSERIQTLSDYQDNLSIVNFTEYTSMVEDNIDISTYGENVEYPRSTALMQTNDADKINIYNSFDSFVQHLVNVNFKMVGSSIRNDGVDYFNLNSDLGFMPQYADKVGTSRIWSNSALSNGQSYSIQLLGPEKSDVPFTPVIVENPDEKYGRVVEDYKEYDTTQAYNDHPITIAPNSKYATYEFQLSDVFPSDDWDTLNQTNDLLRYKYILYNTKYESCPILKGDLSAGYPSQNYYQGNELYDLISGDEVIGPNGQSYQNINLTNHINNISQITLSVINDNETMLPSKVQLSIDVRQVVDSEQIISENQFRLFIYAKNNLMSYKYYHILENPNSGSGFDRISQNEEYEIDFTKISSLANYEIDGKHPFKNKNDDAQRFNQMSADLEFKYSEEDPIDNEFPHLDASDVEDEIVIMQNDSQNTYFFSIDSFNTISSLDTFKMEVYDPENNRYSTEKIIPSLPKYHDFYNRALTIEATYNMESADCTDNPCGYEIIEYFNYKNFTDPQYVKYERGEGDNAPSSSVYNSTDKQIEHTWLALRPGESGRLDLSVDFLKYGKLSSSDIDQSVLGLYVQNIATYYIMNVSDDKPKFIISRKPFSASIEIQQQNHNYELEDPYQYGMKFRYMMLVINETRGLNSYDPKYGFVGLSKIKFYNKNNERGDNKMFNKFDGTTVSIAGGNVIEPNKPQNLINYSDPKSEFLASNVTFPLSIMFDMKEQIFDVDEWPNWEWLNCNFSSTHLDFIPKNFYIAFSNDRKRWYKADSFNDTGNSIPTTNGQLGYTGHLNIEVGS